MPCGVCAAIAACAARPAGVSGRCPTTWVAARAAYSAIPRRSADEASRSTIFSQPACASGFLNPGPVSTSSSARTRSGCASARCIESSPPNESPPTTAGSLPTAQSSTRARSSITRSM